MDISFSLVRVVFTYPAKPSAAYSHSVSVGNLYSGKTIPYSTLALVTLISSSASPSPRTLICAIDQQMIEFRSQSHFQLHQCFRQNNFHHIQIRTFEISFGIKIVIPRISSEVLAPLAIQPLSSSINSLTRLVLHLAKLLACCQLRQQQGVYEKQDDEGNC
ncbi:MAG: hypothetical protein CM15mP59_3390 [Flavobacteriaceae bacterium]|nr:MAG: hypothetical protein CM15mP59_3390 [Flavobacteriaceae bacterium]